MKRPALHHARTIDIRDGRPRSITVERAHDLEVVRSLEVSVRGSRTDAPVRPYGAAESRLTRDVVVSMGTDTHHFERLTGWVEDWARSRGAVDRCLVQHGKSPAPTGVEGRDFLTRDELLTTFASATVVVTHGGPGTILAARGAGLCPIVVPRRQHLGEHVDDHQLMFARRMATAGLVLLVEEEGEFHDTLDRVVADPSLVAVSPWQSNGVVETVARFGDVADRLIAHR